MFSSLCVILFSPFFSNFWSAFFFCSKHASWHFSRKSIKNPKPLCANSSVSIIVYVNLGIFPLRCTTSHLWVLNFISSFTIRSFSTPLSLFLVSIHCYYPDQEHEQKMPPFSYNKCVEQWVSLLDPISHLPYSFPTVTIPWELFYKWLMHVKELSYQIGPSKNFRQGTSEKLFKSYMTISTVTSK